MEGITLHNLLTAAPRPRNPMLADAFKRIGLAERTGRGVDKIFAGMLRYGRARPSYDQSDSTAVVVRMSHATADLPFLELIVEEEGKLQGPLPVDSLIALAELREARRISVEEIAKAIQRDEVAARRVLERLVEAGIVDAHGNTRGRFYTLSASAYKKLGSKMGYVRQAGLDAVEQEHAVMKLARTYGTLKRSEVIELCRITPKQASRLLAKLVQGGQLVMTGTRKTAAYRPADATTAKRKKARTNR